MFTEGKDREIFFMTDEFSKVFKRMLPNKNSLPDKYCSPKAAISVNPPCLMRKLWLSLECLVELALISLRFLYDCKKKVISNFAVNSLFLSHSFHVRFMFVSRRFHLYGERKVKHS